MASSTKEDCCVCVYASQVARKPTEEEQEDDNFTINVKLDIHDVSYDPTPSMSKPPCRLTWSRIRTFNHSRSTFCSMSEYQQLEFAMTMMQDLGLDIPFRLENIHWGAKFPSNIETSRNKLDSVDQAVSRFLDAARECAGEKGNGMLEIRIRQLHKLSLEEYNKGSSSSNTSNCVEKGPLGDWMEENQDDRNAERGLRIAFYLHQKSRKTNPCFGLKSVMVKETGEGDKEEPSCCSICTNDMEKGKQAIQMPCSHMFHGACILDWIRVNPTCPLCRFVLFRTASKQKKPATVLSKQERCL